MVWSSPRRGQGPTGECTEGLVGGAPVIGGCSARYLPPECFIIGKAPPKISSKVRFWLHAAGGGH